jgi:hypothetical protein
VDQVLPPPPPKKIVSNLLWLLVPRLLVPPFYVLASMSPTPILLGFFDFFDYSSGSGTLYQSVVDHGCGGFGSGGLMSVKDFG